MFRYLYFVSFYFSNHNGDMGFGSGHLDMNHKMSRRKDAKDMETAMKLSGNYDNLVILNAILLRRAFFWEAL